MFVALLWLVVAPALAQSESEPSVVLKEQQTTDEFDYLNLPTNSHWENLEFDNSIYTSPYKISLFKPQNGEDSQRLWSQSKSVFGDVLAIAGASLLLPDSIRHYDDETGEPLYKKWGDHVKAGPVWDRDLWFYNYIGHPYLGGAYYQMARKSGYRQWDSAVYSFMMSTFWWEYGIEAFAEIPSIQDLVVTPILGWVVGEWMFNKEQQILQRGGTVWGSRKWGSTALFFLDPIDTVGSWINNRLGHQFITAGTGYVRYDDVPMGSTENAPTEKQFSVGFQYTINQGNEPVYHKRYQAISNDPVDTGIIGISLGVGRIRLEDKLIRLTLQGGWYYVYYDNFEADTYPEFTLGLYFNPRFSTRFRYGRTKVMSEPSGDKVTYENYGLDSQYYFNADANTRPFVTFGIGEEIFDKNRKVKNFLLTFGLGLHHKINNRWAVYGNWIVHHSASADVTQQSASVNLLYRFGRGEDGSL